MYGIAVWGSCKHAQTCQVTDIAVPDDKGVRVKGEEMVDKYQDLARDIGKMWRVRTKIVDPVVLGALETVPKMLENNLRGIGVETSVYLIQKTTALEPSES